MATMNAFDYSGLEGIHSRKREIIDGDTFFKSFMKLDYLAMTSCSMAGEVAEFKFDVDQRCPLCTLRCLVAIIKRLSNTKSQTLIDIGTLMHNWLNGYQYNEKYPTITDSNFPLMFAYLWNKIGLNAHSQACDDKSFHYIKLNASIPNHYELIGRSDISIIMKMRDCFKRKQFRELNNHEIYLYVMLMDRIHTLTLLEHLITGKLHLNDVKINNSVLRTNIAPQLVCDILEKSLHDLFLCQEYEKFQTIDTIFDCNITQHLVPIKQLCSQFVIFESFSIEEYVCTSKTITECKKIIELLLFGLLFWAMSRTYNRSNDSDNENQLNIGDGKRIFKAYSLLGKYYSFLGDGINDWKKAKRCFERALQSHPDPFSPRNKYHWKILTVYINLAYVHARASLINSKNSLYNCKCFRFRNDRYKNIYNCDGNIRNANGYTCSIVNRHHKMASKYFGEFTKGDTFHGNQKRYQCFVPPKSKVTLFDKIVCERYFNMVAFAENRCVKNESMIPIRHLFTKQDYILKMKNILHIRECYNKKCMVKHVRLKKCKRCLSAFYCSRKCQKFDWNTNHRNVCVLSFERTISPCVNAKFGGPLIDIDDR